LEKKGVWGGERQGKGGIVTGASQQDLRRLGGVDGGSVFENETGRIAAKKMLQKEKSSQHE